MREMISTEDYYVASIDLLGFKSLIKSDIKDENLNKIRNIYNSWPTILKEGYFQDMKIRFFSDNLVLALLADKYGAADKLIETVAWICKHFLKCGYKPRGGISRGKFYIDDVFVWGAALVDAYKLESEEALYPRIIIDEKIISDTSAHLSNWMIYRDDGDGKLCLNYLKAFGGNKEGWIEDIEVMLANLNSEIDELEEKTKNEKNCEIMKKLLWLRSFEEKNKLFWIDYR